MNKKFSICNDFFFHNIMIQHCAQMERAWDFLMFYV